MTIKMGDIDMVARVRVRADDETDHLKDSHGRFFVPLDVEAHFRMARDEADGFELHYLLVKGPAIKRDGLRGTSQRVCQFGLRGVGLMSAPQWMREWALRFMPRDEEV